MWTVISRGAREWVVVSLAVAVCGLACDDGGPIEPSTAVARPSDGSLGVDGRAVPAPERWTRRFVPPEADKYDSDRDAWVPESQADNGPETEPGMVIWEVSEFQPGSEPTAEQRRAADDLVERCYAAALRHGWDDFEKGAADGFSPVDRHHYRNDEFMLDDRVLDPDHPETLMYYATPEGQRLAGMMFFARDRDARGRQIGGPLTIWHYHSWFRAQCVVKGLSQNWSVDGKCAKGVPSHRSGEMMHVWLVDHPSGRFATPMFLPYPILSAGLEKRLRERGF